MVSMGSASVAPSGGDPRAGAADVLADLVSRSATGDEAAFAELYDRLAPRVYGLVRRILVDPAQSEEVSQEVFLDLWRSSGRFDSGRGTVLGWAMTIAHRKAVDRVRSVTAARARDETYAASTLEVEHDSTSEMAQDRLDATRVRAALANLTDTQRGAVELAYLGGRTHQEVAQVLDLPLGTAKTRIRDGLRRLRSNLGVTP